MLEIRKFWGCVGLGVVVGLLLRALWLALPISLIVFLVTFFFGIVGLAVISFKAAFCD